MKTLKISIRGIILGMYLAGTHLLAQTLPIPPNLINFDSLAGERLLWQSKSKDNFSPLMMQFVTQINQAYCGVASMVMVLNSLKVPAPEALEYKPYHIFTQENFFNNESTKKILPPEVVAHKGMTLNQLAGLLSSYGVKVKVYHAGDTSLKQFRKLAAKNLHQRGNFIIVNYLRKKIGQQIGGHISPIAAYNEQTDRFLILDVSRYKYPPVWVKSADLWQAMNTIDSDSGKTRGFVLVSKN